MMKDFARNEDKRLDFGWGAAEVEPGASGKGIKGERDTRHGGARRE